MDDDEKLPESLVTLVKITVRTGKLIDDQLKLLTKQAQYVSFQGMFRKTIIVTLKEAD